MLKFWQRLRTDFYSLYHLKASPREIATGVAIGTMLDFIPTFGCGVAISAVLSSWWGGNITASVIANLALGPLIPLFYALNIITGKILLGRLNPRLADKLLHFSVESISPKWLLPYMQHRALRWLKMFGPDFLLGSTFNAVLCFFLVRSLLPYLLQHKFKQSS